MSLERAYSEIQSRIGNRFDLESFNVVKSVDEHRNFWKPSKIRVLLLAESHVFTTDEEHNSIMKFNISELKECPAGYVKLVYCLGYGENDAAKIPVNRGAPQFWKIFASCIHPDVDLESAKILKSTTNFKQRLCNKISILERLKEKGIWLIDASIVALYKDAMKPKPEVMHDVIKISWKHHVSKVIWESNPQKIIVIGKWVHKILEHELRTTGIPILVQKQPRGIRTKSEIKDTFENYYRFCNN